MTIFYDTSAIVPLILREPHSDLARHRWQQGQTRLAWRWLKVESEAALARRQAPMQAWTNWDRIETSLTWVELPENLYGSLCRFIRSIGLRAADAGHLFVMEHLSRTMEGLRLASFDEEMLMAARQLNLAVQ